MTKENKEIRAEQRRKRQERYKAERRCVSCGKQDEKTLEGKARCNECAKRAHQFKRAKKHSYTEADAAYQKERREKMRKERRCVECGCRDARTISGLVLCEDCKNRRSKYSNDYHAKKRKNKLEEIRRREYRLRRLLDYPMTSASMRGIGVTELMIYFYGKGKNDEGRTTETAESQR